MAVNFAASTRVLFAQIVLLSFGVRVIEADNAQIKRDLIYGLYANTSNILKEILSHDWRENHQCLNELNAIKNGLDNHELWAFRGEFEC